MRCATAFITVVLGLMISTAAFAERRVALVIGNGAYQHAPPLIKPANDARAVAAALGRLGFDVVSGTDLGKAEMRAVLQGFVEKLAGADTAVFFYTGHGLQVAGANVLVPIDAATHTDLDTNTVSVDVITREMNCGAKAKVIILDASRENPFAKERAPGNSSPTEASDAGNTITIFASEPGGTVRDGDGPHSPFTAALLKHLETPRLEIGSMMRRVSRDVSDATGGRQLPWVRNSLTGALYLAP